MIMSKIEFFYWQYHSHMLPLWFLQDMASLTKFYHVLFCRDLCMT
ncbi:hypothetical protein Ccrd_022948 [Cynara cardunculus var. scolymus]|uniref:Uncharacterized protein n=1 Tax=Cynara cardunculus var. scolymus TaxID=59895 RepID=A0A103XXN0_CYNCS|nr:hypothetical protein Ccrd_022948 [Cynara cardunculus var. scolymus]